LLEAIGWQGVTKEHSRSVLRRRIDQGHSGCFHLSMNRAACAYICSMLCLSFPGQAAPAMSWCDGRGFRSLEVYPTTRGKAGFTLMDAKATAVWFTNELRGDALLTNVVAHTGAGLALGDVDGDGWLDIYLCTLQGANQLYRNLGHWHFEEMAAGEAACAGQLSTGATFADVDGDGDLDLLVNGIVAGTRLFLNDGKGKLTEAKDSGLSRTASATSLALADMDGDGDLDLYCTHYIDVMHLFDPTTRFSIIKREGRWMVLKVNDQPTTLPPWKDRFEALPDGKVRELPEVDGLYRNDGQGHFAPIQFEPGVFVNEEGKAVPPYRDWGLSVMFRDINGDGIPDLYICNDNASRADRIWINSGKGTFRALDPLTLRHTSRASMGVDFADIDRDGHDDFIVVDMLARDHEKRMTQLFKDAPDPQEHQQINARPRYGRNTLFFGRPDGSFAEAAYMAGVAASDWSWCVIFIDVDLDGYEDLLVTNGFEYDLLDQDSQNELRNPQRRLTREQLKRSNQFRPHARTQNAAFRNRGDGTFAPMSRQWGFDQDGVSYGMALGDLDNDGDLDVVVNNLNAVASLYRNDVTAGRIAVRLKGLAPNTQGVGARVRLVGGSITQSQEMICGGRYLSGDQAMRVFAADADSGKPMRLEVVWRDGDQSVITNIQPNRIYEVDEATSLKRESVEALKRENSVRSNTSTAQPLSASTIQRFNPLTLQPFNESEPFFADVSSLLGHVHTEDSFDDWDRQPLLPRRLSRLGPGVSWYDLNADGWEDLIVTADRAGSLAAFTNNHGQSFRRLEGIPPAKADQGAVVGWPDGKGNRMLLVAVSNYEMPPEQETQISVYSPSNGAAPRNWPAGKSSIGPLAEADIDGDGDLDLFVGGRFRPGRYPEPVSSALWLNDQGELRPSHSASEPFESLGLVSGAVFSDLDGDGCPDLALAVEWGPVRVFRNNNGHFEDRTAQWGFAGRTGWWTGITTGDFDGDGRLDLALANWGRNSMYEIYRDVGPSQGGTPNPRLRLFYDDWNSDGTVEMIEAWQHGENWLPVRSRLWLASGFPELANQFPTHQAFSKATVQEMLGPRYEKAKMLEATELASGIFLNRGSHFDWVPLPREAQMAPVFSVNVGDFNGDGMEDLFLSQNFFGTPSDLARDDSGRGLWLRGSGQGTFIAVDASITGIKIYGEQRGAALADFNRDGRVDMAVSQNNGATKLYVNHRGKRGLRVVLNGPPANPDAVGAQLRVHYAGGRVGPCRIVQAGSGYWSQDGAAQVLGLADLPVALRIRWPGGKEQTVRLEDHAWDLRLSFEDEPK
jgi:enediyne biosynthesis protein E4